MHVTRHGLDRTVVYLHTPRLPRVRSLCTTLVIPETLGTGWFFEALMCPVCACVHFACLFRALNENTPRMLIDLL